MPKKYWLLLIALGLLVVGKDWIGFSSSQRQPIQLAQLTLDSTIYPKIDIIHTTMKPAWYQFFVPRTSLPKAPNKTASIAFIPQPNPQNPTLTQWYLLNQQATAFRLPTQNGSLFMIQEAQDSKGNWKPVEYWTAHWGNASMPAVEGVFILEPQKAIMIVAPKYEGELKTNLRFKFKAIDQKGKRITLYSPVFRGAIPPSQFDISPEEKKKGVSYLD